MTSLRSALNWYHKKIGAYDKELWEKSVDRRILRGVCAIPRKSTRIKTELIDVDLVRGSAFAKAKPQHSWISATIAGVKRVLLMPFFFSWWKVQTNSLVSGVLVFLYILQIGALLLYFFASDKDFLEVPILEILTPAAMMSILGIVLSQIVATFTSKKRRKHLARDKRRRIKSKQPKKQVSCDLESKSSAESASDCGEDKFDGTLFKNIPASNSHKKLLRCNCLKTLKEGRSLRFSLADQNKTESTNEESEIKDSDSALVLEESSSLLLTNKSKKLRNLSEESQFSHISNDSAFQDGVDHPPNEEVKTVNELSTEASKVQTGDLDVRTHHINGDGNLSSSDDFFVTRKSSSLPGHLKNYKLEEQTKCSTSKLDSGSYNIANRRYSDEGIVQRKQENYGTFLSLQNHRLSADNILTQRSGVLKQSSDVPLQNNQNAATKCNCNFGSIIRKKRPKLPGSLKLSMNIPSYSSSCESEADTTSPNTPSQPQQSDLDWPLITNTDCNSDSTDSSSNCSGGNSSDISPSENPFAWEIHEPSKKVPSVGYIGLDKGYRPRAVSCTIWQLNECKKVDLTALDISSAIIHKVDSSKHHSEYLYIGVLCATLLSLLPLLFRLRNGLSVCDVPTVATDILTLNVPTTEEVVKITDSFLDIVLGPNLKVKLVVMIIMLERFVLSLGCFFLLSVAEKTFTQRFLYAKHFCYLTSSRRAKRSDLPHFRLNKVKNIKIWLSIRSYLKKLGPQRSVDVIVSITFIIEVCIVSFLCIQFLKEEGQFTDQLYCWELSFWTMTLGLYLLRFMVIGTKINKKYRNLSVLITEQINLYLHMEQKPHKKEELILANNVLKLAADLLKELESPFKISGLCANSYLYNITKVIVLSAFSAMLTDVLGFKLKLYKIKIK
ncbi:protein PHTF2 isoform X2 [Parasteatoda tepidariorum]|uniref:protein PHTF2 isoform X2 n=1 Tax=Parasteatoda tepidariorum TaxID=114398 RepID=UPI001C7204C8|nr:protein PHTF2 isoform X2 [Parasteatoda tepidariorum]